MDGTLLRVVGRSPEERSPVEDGNLIEDEDG
jgi:hypothetical protein